MRQLRIYSQITERESVVIDRYLREIAVIRLLTPADEIRLARRIRAGDEAALHALVKANLRFVVSVAKQYQNQGLTLLDLINEGNMGLIIAARKFDETRGFKFISYAVWWIRQAIMHAISQYGRTVRLPSNKITLMNKIFTAASLLEQRLERTPSTAEIATDVDMDEEIVADAMHIRTQDISLDAPSPDKTCTTLNELLGVRLSTSPDEQLLRDSLRKDINSLFAVLPSREQALLVLYFGLNGHRPKSINELAAVFRISPERVRQVRNAAIRKIRNSKRKDKLQKYL